MQRDSAVSCVVLPDGIRQYRAPPRFICVRKRIAGTGLTRGLDIRA